MSARVFVTCHLPSVVLDKLAAVATVDVYEGAGAVPREELRARVEDCDAVMTLLTDTVDRDILDRARALKIVANVAVGYNNIDVAAATVRGIIVTNTPDVLTDAVADFTWGLILAVTRRISEGERLVRRGAWQGWAFDSMLGVSLAGKQLGIVGAGRIGRAVAARAGAFGMRVVYAAKRGATTTAEGVVPLDVLLHASDIVSLHVPLTADTRHVIDARALARMKRSAFLVNTSRGPVVDEGALAWALAQHLIAGAALDVYENEPSIHPDLFTLENVVLAPHQGSATIEARTAMADLAAANVLAVLAGEPPLTPVR